MIDFITLCREKRLPYIESGNHHCHEGWVQTHCPFCGDGSHGWHLGFNLEFGNMNCWRCGKHSMYDYLSSMLPAGARSQIKSILKKYQSTVRRAIGKKESKVRKRNIKPPKGTDTMKPRHRKYLKARGFDPEYLEDVWCIQGTQHLSRDWNWRVVAPITDIEGRVVAYTGRALNKEVRPRWKTTDNADMGDDPRKLVYGLQYAKPERGVLIVEGPSDVWRMGQGCVGLLGIDWKVEQAAILRQFKNRFILFDPGPVAQKRAEELAHWLAPLPGHTEILYDLPSDPGDLPQEEADGIMRELRLKK